MSIGQNWRALKKYRACGHSHIAKQLTFTTISCHTFSLPVESCFQPCPLCLYTTRASRRPSFRGILLAYWIDIGPRLPVLHQGSIHSRATQKNEKKKAEKKNPHHHYKGYNHTTQDKHRMPAKLALNGAQKPASDVLALYFPRSTDTHWCCSLFEIFKSFKSMTQAFVRFLVSSSCLHLIGHSSALLNRLEDQVRNRQ